MTRTRALVVALAVAALAAGAFVVSGGTGSGPSTAAARLRTWVTSTKLGQDVGTLRADSSDVRRAVASGRSGAVRTVCAAMANDAETFNGELPSPDTSVTGLLARAYALEYDAAEACYRAGTADTALLATSARDRSRASALLDEAVRRVARLTHRSVPTTTTTVPTQTATSFL